jgi:hypothetical protein
MFKTAPQVIDQIPVVQIICPICHGDTVEPTSNLKDTWECCDCGMGFEVTDAI